MDVNHSSQYQCAPWRPFYIVFLRNLKSIKAPSIGLVSDPQWIEEAEERQRPGVDQSILSFPGYPHSQSPLADQLRANPGWAEIGCSHASNKSHTAHGNKTLREVLLKQSFVSVLPATLPSAFPSFYQKGCGATAAIIHLSLLILNRCIISKEKARKYALNTDMAQPYYNSVTIKNDVWLELILNKSTTVSICFEDWPQLLFWGRLGHAAYTFVKQTWCCT